LHFTSRINALTATQLLLEKGANPNLANQNKSTPLLFSTSDQMTDILKKYEAL